MRLQPVQDLFQRPTDAVRLDGSTSWLERQAEREVEHAGHAGAATLGVWPLDLSLTEGPALLHGIVENPDDLEIACVDTRPIGALLFKLPSLNATRRGNRMGSAGQLHLFDAKRRQLAA